MAAQFLCRYFYLGFGVWSSPAIIINMNLNRTFRSLAAGKSNLNCFFSHGVIASIPEASKIRASERELN